MGGPAFKKRSFADNEANALGEINKLMEGRQCSARENNVQLMPWEVGRHGVHENIFR